MHRNPTAENIEHCARICHALNTALCVHNGEDPLPWEAVKDSCINGIRAHLREPWMSAEENHNNWMAFRKQEGWVYGPVKDPVEKTHPCMVPYHELSEFQRLKDDTFSAIVRAYFGL